MISIVLWLVIPISTVCFCCLVIVWLNLSKKRKLDKSSTEPYSDPFSVSEYYKRIERTWLEFLSEQECVEKYTLVLWVGLDGLRLNDDGTMEWIKRDMYGQTKPREISLANEQSYVPCFSNLQNTIMSLQEQKQALLFREAQNLQWQNLINSLQFTPPMSPYIQSAPYYDNLLVQCCCNYKI